MICLGRKSKRSRIEVGKMFVSETSIFSPHVIKLFIIYTDGTEWQLDVTPDFSIERLKTMALSHFTNPLEGAKVAGNYKLLLVSEGRQLLDESTLMMENVKDNDELIVLRHRSPPLNTYDQPETLSSKSTNLQNKSEQVWKGPDDATIQQMTASIPPRNFDRVAEDSTTVMDVSGQNFQSELRKILISLVDASQKILCRNPDILPIFTNMQEKLDEQTANEVDRTAVKQLTDMGFPESKAIKALKLHKMSPVEAMEWLLEHNMDADMETESQTPACPTEIKSAAYMQRTAVSTSSSSDGDDMNSPETAPTEAACSPTRKPCHYTVAEILNTFRAYKRRGFRPNPRALHNLKEMGFAEEEIIDGLRISGNNQDGACEWLLGDRRPTAEDMEKGLDPEGSIYKAIISNPIVQLGLSNPKTLLAFLHMLENPNTANHWLNDADTAPLLSQIFRIYHAEKHSLQMKPASDSS